MQRADIWIYGAGSRDEIYGGLISGYTAKLAAFVGFAHLDKGKGNGGYCPRFYCFRPSLWIVVYRARWGAVYSQVRCQSVAS